MIKTISNIFELDKILRKYLISQSNLKPDVVVNALSVRGPDLELLISNNTYFSPNLNDVVLIFENETNETTNNVSVDEEDATFTIYQSFRCKIVIYGNYSKTLALILKTRFESDTIRDKLFEEGINLENVSNPVSINEFKNETVWIRTDLNIEYSCRLNVQPIAETEQLENISKLIVIKED